MQSPYCLCVSCIHIYCISIYHCLVPQPLQSPHHHPSPVANLSSMKPVPDEKEVGDRWYNIPKITKTIWINKTKGYRQNFIQFFSVTSLNQWCPLRSRGRCNTHQETNIFPARSKNSFPTPNITSGGFHLEGHWLHQRVWLFTNVHHDPEEGEYVSSKGEEKKNSSWLQLW